MFEQLHEAREWTIPFSLLPYSLLPIQFIAILVMFFEAMVFPNK